MKDTKTFEKMQDYEKKVFPVIEAAEKEGKLPDILKNSFDAVRNGDTSKDAYGLFSAQLFDYQHMFGEKERSHIAEYRELIDAYFSGE